MYLTDICLSGSVMVGLGALVDHVLRGGRQWMECRQVPCLAYCEDRKVFLCIENTAAALACRL